MKSIQTKFITLILGCVLICSTVIGGAGIINAERVVDEDAAQLMNYRCSELASEMDALLSRIELSVKTLTVFTNDHLESVDQLKNDEAYMKAFTDQLESVAVNAANNTEGAVAVYVRFNPDFAPPTSGLFWSKTNLNGSFQRLVPTDFSKYSPTDAEHVGWYYIPVKNGKATWLAPYSNENINVQMISYVIPIYKENETVGVVGMDIDFDIIKNMINDVHIYDTGYAFLADDKANVMCHKTYPFGIPMSSVDQSLTPLITELENGTSGSSLFSYVNNDVKKKMAFRTLRNGMRLVLTAPLAEIDKSKNQLLLQIIIALLIIAPLSVLVTVLITRRIIKPLKELNTAAKKIAEGDLSISLTQQTKDEVGMLADSFQQTVCHLQKYINYINSLAYRDALTGVKNKAAYQDAERRIEEQMRQGHPEFAVVVLDINDLKRVNDHFGHDFGDMLIVDACRLICKSFPHSPVYRVGGDEFAVILEGAEYTNYVQLLENLKTAIIEYNENSPKDNQLSIARGIAIYNCQTDLVFSNVFKRADDAMYQNKADMKQRRTAAEDAKKE
ncbi:sensor domain-containing diguanylate cyclase [Clostridium sp. chh4-2]|uniref:sensor domain-containing diguanylate cyclase n=1 Tax=Clostridium sp. chh4-2 TaxID=2067550 RepID=UPI000CCDDF13|nr:diguanylate cyclase [Clostridium sp. chh4-2]PNV61208.1 sensor domain-containing diguanylate cyclase [Clostridium sp. chh4-2]